MIRKSRAIHTTKRGELQLFLPRLPGSHLAARAGVYLASCVPKATAFRDKEEQYGNEWARSAPSS
ncbi:protein of unknown function [Candidatus Promineifilum breve]|uniref:Uncharacterized protein n=1 Tax=Candidatus Promineifilum breve TaxID=1806508 RepID=A0A160T401_9CHLR|nr:protein of unknown function [Candidatus Promineifilum breve]